MLLLKGKARRAIIDAGSTAQLELGGFPVRSAKVFLSRHAGLTLRVEEKLDYHLSGSAELIYAGEPSFGRRELTGKARILPE